VPRGSEAPTTRILVAGVGNVLRADDGFGPAVVRALESGGALPDGVRTIEVGIGGIGLVHELMSGYDALVVVDAVDRDGPPGTLYVLEPEVPGTEALSVVELGSLALDIHQVVPGSVLTMARALNILPPLVRIIGCQPAETEEFSTDLTPVVQSAVPQAVMAIRSLMASFQGNAGGTVGRT
jgi:hydrogenase maturation protease